MKPEISQTVGVIFEPTAGLNILADFYAVELENTYRQDSIQAIADGWYRENPGATEDGVFEDNGVSVDGDGIITQISPVHTVTLV